MRRVAIAKREGDDGTDEPMIDDLYNAKILDLAGNIDASHRLDAPDATATAHSKLCGSVVTVDLTVDGDTISDYGHEVKACALGQASSAVVADWPGLSDRALYQNRDVRPTLDTRAVLKGVIAGAFDLTESQANRVFPGSAGIRGAWELMS